MTVSITKNPQDPRGFRLVTELVLPAPREEVFEYFADACNLEQITPPWLCFQVDTPRPIAMQSGTLIDYRLKLHQIPIRWRTEISDWEPPFQFVDRQLRGPYRYWIHTHTFEAQGEQTLMRDQVDYAVPGGALIHSLLVKRDVRRIFEFRRERMLEVFGKSAAVAS